MLCKDSSYGNPCDLFTGSDPDLRNNWIGDNAASSLVVAPGVVAAVYLDHNYAGPCLTLTGGTAIADLSWVDVDADGWRDAFYSRTWYCSWNDGIASIWLGGRCP